MARAQSLTNQKTSLGQAIASELISFSHSSHLMSAIFSPTTHLASNLFSSVRAISFSESFKFLENIQIPNLYWLFFQLALQFVTYFLKDG